MLNLSDKELDRLSREAAQEHDPGDVLGSRSWEKLEPQLDKELGRSGPNPLRGVRRFPIYYVPAALLLVAGIFFFSKPGGRNTRTHIASGSPPTARTTTPAGTTPSASAASESNGTSETKTNSSNQNTDYSTNNSTPSNSTASAESAGSTAANTRSTASNSSPDLAAASTGSTSSNARSSAANLGSSTSNTRSTAADKRSTAAASNLKNRNHNNRPHKGHSRADRLTIPGSTEAANTGTQTNVTNPEDIDFKKSQSATGAQSRPHDLTLSPIHSPRRSPKQTPVINDSALRAYKVASTTQPAKSKSLHINRSLQFGLQLAPDFSSVNSLAGDKPGSSIGITVDYQFANRWYLGAGLLLDRKNYAARPQDYKVPYDYYPRMGMHNVNLIKGSFHMLEIPINLRYDFSVTGSTMFFASAGVSSYLLTNENCNYYFDMFGREVYKTFDYKNNNNYLAASVSLSVGVETGISNNLSLLIAPYAKLPSRKMGFGQVPVNSVGINFALKFAPVISRKRK